MEKKLLKNLEEFLRESNLIEQEPREIAFKDAWKAWKFLENFDELTLTRILETHKVLAGRLNPGIAGKIRTCSVCVGYHIMPRPEKVKELLERWINTSRDLKDGKDILQAHIAFEEIHPFKDFNGRIGRILWNWQRIKAGLPIRVIHAGWIEQDEYYCLFKKDNRYIKQYCAKNQINI